MYAKRMSTKKTNTKYPEKESEKKMPIIIPNKGMMKGWFFI